MSIRLRLSLWYAAALLLLLLVYGGGVVAFVWRSLGNNLDQRLNEDFDVAASMFERSADGHIHWHWEVEHEGEEFSYQVSAEIWNHEGRLLGRNGSAAWFGQDARPPEEGHAEIGHLTLPGGERVRYLERSHTIDGLDVILRVYRSEDVLHESVNRLAFAALLVLPVGILIACIGGYALANHLLAPIAHLTRRAATITAERLDERLPVDVPADEVGQLATVFNQTFARLEQSFDELRRFTADASHELRTPLTSIRSVGEVALREPRDAEGYRDVIGSMLEEADRLARLVDGLLTLSRADSDRVVLRRERFDLLALTRDVVSDLGVLAEEKQQELAVEADASVEIDADRDVLRRALANLVDNAIKYSTAGAAIRVVVERDGQTASVKVIDRGCGIPASQSGRVFERFYRVDRSRSRQIGGTGLGLAIARWAVEANDGVLDLETVEGEGSVFRISLPVADGISST